MFRFAPVDPRKRMAPLPATDVDTSLLNELFEEIAKNPPAIEARKLLVQQYIQVGWNEAAYDEIQVLLTLVPLDTEVKGFLELFPKQEEPKDSPKPPPITAPLKRKGALVALPDDLATGQNELARDYQALRSSANSLLSELRLLRDLHQQQDAASQSFDKHIPDLAALAAGRITSTVRVKQPGSARFVARAMAAEPPRAVSTFSYLSYLPRVKYCFSHTDKTHIASRPHSLNTENSMLIRNLLGRHMLQ
jgi:hypothetical protein